MTAYLFSQADVPKNGAAVFLARVVGFAGLPIVQADASAIGYTIWLLDENDPNAETAVTGHNGVNVNVASSVFNTLVVNDPRWDSEQLGGGYNFLHALDTNANPAFSLRNRRYLVRYTFTPPAGSKWHVDFLVSAR
jgi:hypothetical protein